ncbi:MAG TPA: AmmeMemoRadiSam system radical SAM enzyme [Clostridiaceae bacterium]|nr:AmmeMemoRadiSam system radical SAM enzyme [Clostridiaceae bacterium]
MYFEKIENSKVRCFLCPHNCIIKPGGLGICRARKNLDGRLYSLNYGKITALALDPIEKKPLNRFNPGSIILSAGTFGCNLKCSFCQNWGIAHSTPDVYEMMPMQLADKAAELKENGNIGLAYTYNEPSIWYEHVYETARIIHSRGLVNVLVTNGYISPEPLRDILPCIDAMNIDVKAYTEAFYKKVCGADLENVKKTVAMAVQSCHVEITTLIVPELNDSMEEIESLAKWIASISPEIPLHLSRFFPNYKMQNKMPTPVETLYKARDKAREYLKHVYLGNVR